MCLMHKYWKLEIIENLDIWRIDLVETSDIIGPSSDLVRSTLDLDFEVQSVTSDRTSLDRTSVRLDF